MKTITYKNEALSEAAVYKKLGALTKDKSGWERHIPDLAALLASGSPKIQAKAFYGCKKLTKVVIGKNVTEIGAQAFYQCEKLAKATIGAGVKTIGKQAFSGCRSLKTIIIKSKLLTAKKTGAKAFQGIFAKAAITVPAGKEKAYRSILEKKGSGKKIKIKATK